VYFLQLESRHRRVSICRQEMDVGELPTTTDD
jgi:hypothetical protein